MTEILHKCTPDEVALIRWLQAEREWVTKVEWARRRGEQELQREAACREQARAAQVVLAAHRALVADVDPFRRAVLELHGPHTSGVVTYLMWDCFGCDPGEYAQTSARWPCETYELARNWEAA